MQGRSGPGGRSARPALPSSVAWGAVELAVRFGSQALVTFVLARFVSPAEFGLVAIVMVFVAVGQILGDAGFGVAIVREPELDSDDPATAFLASLFAGAIAGLLLWSSAGWIARAFSQPLLTGLVSWLALALPIGASAVVPDALLTRAMAFRVRALVEIASSTTAGAAAIAMAVSGAGVWSLVVFSLVAMFLRSLGYSAVAGWRPSGRFRIESFRRLFGFGRFLMISALLDALATRLQSLTLGWIFDAKAVGDFSMAQNLQQAPTFFVGRLLDRVGLPVFASHARDRNELRDAFRTSNSAALFAFMPAMLLAAICASDIVHVVLGDKWEGVVPVFRLLAVAACAWTVNVLNLTALKAIGRSDLFLRLEMLKKIVVIAAVAASSPFGSVAVAWSILGASLWGLAVNTRYSKRFLGLGLLDQLRDEWPTLVWSAGAAVAAMSMELLVAGRGPRLVAAASVFVAVYLAGASLSKARGLAVWRELVSSEKGSGPHG